MSVEYKLYLLRHQTDPGGLSDKIMLSGRYDEAGAIWRWGTGEILPTDAPVWVTNEPNGDPSPTIALMVTMDGVVDATDNSYDCKAICEAGTEYTADDIAKKHT